MKSKINYSCSLFRSGAELEKDWGNNEVETDFLRDKA